MSPDVHDRCCRVCGGDAGTGHEGVPCEEARQYLASAEKTEKRLEEAARLIMEMPCYVSYVAGRVTIGGECRLDRLCPACQARRLSETEESQ